MRIVMRDESKFNVVLDVNWYVSACISRQSRRTLFQSILKNPLLKVYYSNELLREFERVISQPRFRKYIPHAHVRRLAEFGRSHAHQVDCPTFPDIVRDPNDNYLLGICDSCAADFLVTGDKDLLDLKRYKTTLILPMSQFAGIICMP